ncbi:MAG: hypothetical protein GX863_08645, partial [Firmicutes bacterium]|nr:hypothetical protein [Candidatus Fermentithermobacillaceae bacterium]
MAKRMTGSKIVPQCANCCLPDFSEGYCTAFDDPEYQWRNGECWGRCDTAEEMIRRLQAIIAYNEGHGMNTAGVAKMKKELKYWQETAR